ncbi:hypothetical protein HMI54_014144 [Coelomomyces lativittatus]|nr:hypothetical protein HMI54_014144 [Coelomomyces lativittatus]
MLWPMIPCLVHDRRILAFAYGLVTCFVNLSLTVIPNFIALQIAADPSYTNGLFSLALLGLFGGLCILGCT